MFYLDANGELKLNSLEVPEESQNRRLIQAAEDLLARVTDDAQSVERSIEAPAKKAIQKARASFRYRRHYVYIPSHSFRFPSFSSGGQQKIQCENCAEVSEGKRCRLLALLQVMKTAQELRSRCYELTDEVVANQQLVNTLKRSVVVAYGQRDAL